MRMKLKGRIKTDATPTLPILGKIKIGETKTGANGKEYPTSLDYFRSTGQYCNYFKDAFGDNCKQLKIVFISNDINEVCNERFECRDAAGRLTGIADGVNYYLFDPKAKKPHGDYVKINRGEPHTPQRTAANELIKKAGVWRHTLRLRFLLPELNGLFGQWELQTFGTESSIPKIIAAFDQVQKNVGTVVNIPFDLLVDKVKSNKPGVSSVYPVLTLVPNLSVQSQLVLAEFLETGQQLKGMLTEQKIKAIAPNDPS